MKKYREATKTHTNLKVRFFLLLFLLGLPSFPFWIIQAQQSPGDLKKQRSAQLWKIKVDQKRLSEISIQKQNSLGELNLIREQIRGQQKLLELLQGEITQLELQIQQINTQAQALEHNLLSVRNEYGQMIYTAAKSSTQVNHLNYIFAADDFNQLYRRLRYLHQYTLAREKQVDHIQKLNQKLLTQRKTAQDLKIQKENLLREKTLESQTLNALEINKSRLVKTLSGKEKELKKELDQNQQELAQLEKMIEGRVHKNTDSNLNALSVEEEKLNPELSQSFIGNRGKLPWPVSEGFVASPFGKYEHPLLKNVMVENAGIDIQTSEGQGIRAVFKGKVSTVASIPGMGGQVLMLEHGEYFTVYARVKDILVAPGDPVKTQQSIATVYTDKQGNSLLQFQIWKSSEKLNPQTWLRKHP